jgi:tripartite-type tricarboxylate transporter receptor subunit TctC
MNLVTTSALLLAASTGLAHAQAYPSKPIRTLIGFAAGGTPDIALRVITPKLGENLGQPIIVENRPGAGATTAMEVAARAAPDGYTLAVGTLGSMILGKALFPKAQFDPVTSFEPISLYSKTSFIVASSVSLAPRNLQDFVALAKSVTAPPRPAARRTSCARCSRPRPASTSSASPSKARPMRPALSWAARCRCSAMRPRPSARW